MTHHIPAPRSASQSNLQVRGQSTTRTQARPPRTSVLSVISLALGIISFPLICVCFLSLFTSIPAIITGHIGYYQCRRSGGALTGGGMSLAGLVMGYIVLLGTVAFLSIGFFGATVQDALNSNHGANVEAAGVPGQAELSKVELAITSDDEGYALGNTAEARQIARTFADEMQMLDKTFFTQTDAKLKLTGGHYVTWCELRDGKCAFVVHVPEYRKFDGKAKETLANLAWATAQRAVTGHLEPEADLAVGLKGVLLYGAVMTGHVEHEDETSGTQLRDNGGDKSLLYPFFVSEPERPPGTVPAAGNDSGSPAPGPALETTPDSGLEPEASADPEAAPAGEQTPAGPASPPDVEADPAAPVESERPRHSAPGRIVPQNVEEALEFLKGDDEIRQQQAVSFLAYGKVTGPDAAVADALFKYLGVEHGGGRFAVASALRKWVSAEDLDRLTPLLDDENVLVRTHVVETIGLLGTKEAAKVLAERLTVQGQSGGVSIPLQRMGAVAEEPVLAQLRKRNLDTTTQTQIILILAEVGGRDSFRALQRIASNQSHPLRFSARSAAQKIQRRLVQ